MGTQWEARISAIKNIQKEFGHDIREMREQLVRLTNLFEDMSKRGGASLRPITLTKSTGPSTIRRNYELSATWN